MRSILEEFDRRERNQVRTLVTGTDSVAREQNIAIAKALASGPRLRVLEYLVTQVASLSQIARDLGMPIATASMHLASLQRAGLVSSQTAPGKRGQQRIFTRLYDTVVFSLPELQPRADVDHYSIHMPVGGFVDHHIVAPCGMASAESIIGVLDDPVLFYDPERHQAQLVWLSHGYLEYRFPNRSYEREDPTSLQLSLELCSEAAPSSMNWPSDIFLEVNGVRIGVWTSPADFGDKRGNLNPAWWPDWNSQYGQLKVWRIDREGASIDGRRLSDVTIRDLDLPARPYVAVRIGVDDEAEHKGGLNIFGRGFGNHPQDIIMQIDYE